MSNGRRYDGAIVLRMAAELGDDVICLRCGATLTSFDVQCLEIGDEPELCPGWCRLNAAAARARHHLAPREALEGRMKPHRWQ